MSLTRSLDGTRLSGVLLIAVSIFATTQSVVAWYVAGGVGFPDFEAFSFVHIPYLFLSLKFEFFVQVRDS